MAVWFSPNHGTKFSDVGTVFRDCFLAEFEDCFMVEFIAVNNSPESCKKNKIKDKTKVKIFGLSPDYFQGPSMVENA